MTTQNQEQETERGRRFGAGVSNAYRTVAGLPARENDEVLSNGEASGARLATEPEGGYGGEGGIANTSAINASEHPGNPEVVDEDGLTGGETATEVARVTGEDVPDVKPAPESAARDEVVEDEDEER